MHLSTSIIQWMIIYMYQTYNYIFLLIISCYNNIMNVYYSNTVYSTGIIMLEHHPESYLKCICTVPSMPMVEMLYLACVRVHE